MRAGATPQAAGADGRVQDVERRGERRHLTEIAEEIERLRRENALAQQALDTLATAIFVTDARLRLLLANEAGALLLTLASSPLGQKGGRLFARDGSDQSCLRLLCAERRVDVPAPRRMLLRAPDDAAPGWSLCAMRLPAGHGSGGAAESWMIALRSLGGRDLPAEAAQAVFGLTEAEARIAAALANGLSLARAAQQQNIRITTARTHLARVFAKTGTHQQSQLAALLHAVELPLRFSAATGTSKEGLPAPGA